MSWAIVPLVIFVGFIALAFVTSAVALNNIESR